MHIEISKAKLRSLLHLAHIGASTKREKDREKLFPDRLTGYEKLVSIEDSLRSQGFYR